MTTTVLVYGCPTTFRSYGEGLNFKSYNHTTGVCTYVQVGGGTSTDTTAHSVISKFEMEAGGGGNMDMVVFAIMMVIYAMGVWMGFTFIQPSSGGLS